MNTHLICDDLGLGATDDRGSRKGHLRSNEVTICSSSISHGKMKIEMHKWCQTTWLIEPPQKMRILTYLGLGSWSDLDLSLTWPKVKFWNWPFNIKKYMFQTRSTSWTRWCHFFYFRSSHVKKVINKNIYIKNDDSYLMTYGAKTIGLRLNLIKKHCQCMRRAP